LVVIHLDGQQLTSFWFTFEDRENPHLRLWYKTMYGTWSLSPVRTSKKVPRPQSALRLLTVGSSTANPQPCLRRCLATIASA
jgi:hypothetical protein